MPNRNLPKAIATVIWHHHELARVLCCSCGIQFGNVDELVAHQAKEIADMLESAYVFAAHKPSLRRALKRDAARQ
jgi:hypothetical protein